MEVRICRIRPEPVMEKTTAHKNRMPIKMCIRDRLGGAEEGDGLDGLELGHGAGQAGVNQGCADVPRRAQLQPEGQDAVLQLSLIHIWRPSFMAAAARYERSFTVSTSPLSAGRGKRTALCSILMPDRLILSCRA